MGDTSQQCWQVGGKHGFEVLVGSIVPQTANRYGGVIETNAFVGNKWNDAVEAKCFGICVHKIVLVAEENLSLDAPMVVDKVRIIEVHTPTLPLRRETAKKQHTAVLGQKWMQGVVLHSIRGAGNVLGVEERDGHNYKINYFLLICRFPTPSQLVQNHLGNAVV